MKKGIVLSVFFVALALLCTMPVQAWQGRISGMGEATGLVEDESDFLTHPAGIADGKGVDFYGTFRTTYDEKTTWKTTVSQTSSSNHNVFSFDGKGDNWKYDGLAGIALPMGKARMGIFLQYSGRMGEENSYDGNENYSYNGSSNKASFVVKDRLDNYALRFLMAAPVGNDKLGGELQIAYRDERRVETYYTLSSFIQNFPWLSTWGPQQNLFFFDLPFDTQYWEVSGKVSAEGSFGLGKYAITLKGGVPFSGQNKYDYDFGGTSSAVMDGNVKGWNIGGDFWYRYPVKDNLSIPLLLSAGYKTMKRDGSGLATWGMAYDYTNQTKNFFVELGGGVDYTLSKSTKIATGLYYNYLYSRDSIDFTEQVTSSNVNLPEYPDFPKSVEHRIIFKAAAEKELSSDMTIRGGMNIFYGRISKTDYAMQFTSGSGVVSTDTTISTTGSDYGVSGSFGITKKMNGFSFEPFINVGLKQVEFSGSDTGFFNGSLYNTRVNQAKKDWFIGGGFSLKF